ncbi:hypothetical protein ykris0001_43520 [Yersinia kristensenii ATCC 33638]|nr:hypothetical protein ykris0001_43520 [Yersinia kristensenii ATCC 33638]
MPLTLGAALAFSLNKKINFFMQNFPLSLEPLTIIAEQLILAPDTYQVSSGIS